MKKQMTLWLVLIGLPLMNSCKKEKPVADFVFTGNGCTPPCEIAFENRSSNAVSYSWDFGDGTGSTEENPSRRYNSQGTYMVTLTAKNKDGASAVVKEIVIAAEKPLLAINNVTVANYWKFNVVLPDDCPVTFTISNAGPAGSTLDYSVADDGALSGFLKIENASGSLASGNSALVSVSVKQDLVPGFWNVNGVFSAITVAVNVYTPKASNFTKMPVFFETLENFDPIGTWSGSWSGFSSCHSDTSVKMPVSGTWLLKVISLNYTDSFINGTLTWQGADKCCENGTSNPVAIDKAVAINHNNSRFYRSSVGATCQNKFKLTLDNQPFSFFGPWIGVTMDTDNKTVTTFGNGFITRPEGQNCQGFSTGTVTGAKN
jgi:PKD repeat protein